MLKHAEQVLQRHGITTATITTATCSKNSSAAAKVSHTHTHTQGLIMAQEEAEQMFAPGSGSVGHCPPFPPCPCSDLTFTTVFVCVRTCPRDCVSVCVRIWVCLCARVRLCPSLQLRLSPVGGSRFHTLEL